MQYARLTRKDVHTIPLIGYVYFFRPYAFLVRPVYFRPEECRLLEQNFFIFDQVLRHIT